MKLVVDAKVMGNTIVLQSKYPPNLQDGRYSVEIKELGKNRSLNQNAMMWALIHEISKKEYGNISASDDIYANLLEMSGVKSEYVTILSEAVDDFKKLVDGHIKLISTSVRNGREFSHLQIMKGSSKFNTKEMANFIDTILDYASQLDIDTTYWREVLNER